MPQHLGVWWGPGLLSTGDHKPLARHAGRAGRWDPVPTVGPWAGSATLRLDGFGRPAACRGSPVKVRRWPATVGEARPRKPGNLLVVSPTNRRGKRGLGTGTAAVSQRFSGIQYPGEDVRVNLRPSGGPSLPCCNAARPRSRRRTSCVGRYHTTRGSRAPCTSRPCRDCDGSCCCRRRLDRPRLEQQRSARRRRLRQTECR